ncbi:MAG: hypothetical protein ABR505_08480 [Actinomycetota bacterium]
MSALGTNAEVVGATAFLAGLATWGMELLADMYALGRAGAF